MTVSTPVKVRKKQKPAVKKTVKKKPAVKRKRAVKKKMGRPTKYRPAMCDRVVEMMADGKSLAKVAAELDITRNTMYEWCKSNSEHFIPDFSDAVSKGKLLSQAWWEEQGRLHLNSKYFNYHGWGLNMRNRFPDDWRDRKEIKQDVKQTIQLSEIDEELLRDSQQPY